MSRAARFALVLILVVALLPSVLLMGCSSPVKPTAGEPAATEPGATQQPASDSPEAALVKQKCTMCHTLDRVDSADYDEAGWTATVERMEKNGLVISADEKATIIQYLSNR